MKTDDLLYKVALTMIPDIGAITAKKLIAYTGSPEAVFRERSHHLLKIPGIGEGLARRIEPKRILPAAEKEVRRIEKEQIGYFYYQDRDYPERLKNCDDGPVLLFHRGNPGLNAAKILSVVGTRSATPYGREVCESIVASLAARHPELVIVSGLAYGIDIIAHRAALENRLETVGVMAHGLTTVYPYMHRDTARKMLKRGGLVTDFHTMVKPERNNFLRRNRLIAGLADATLIIESARRGGALITAGLASSYNRDVLAVPGRIGDSTSAGCNQLIRQNIAALTETARDIEYVLNWQPRETEHEPSPTLKTPLNEEEQSILENIRDDPMIGQDILAVRTGLPVHILMARLLSMELQGWIMVFPGNRYKLKVTL